MEDLSRNNESVPEDVASFEGKKESVRPTPVSLGQKIRIIFLSFISFIVLLLLLKNWHKIPVDLIFKEVIIPVPILLVCVFIVGYFWGAMASRIKQRQKNKNNEA